MQTLFYNYILCYVLYEHDDSCIFINELQYKQWQIKGRGPGGLPHPPTPLWWNILFLQKIYKKTTEMSIQKPF